MHSWASSAVRWVCPTGDWVAVATRCNNSSGGGFQRQETPTICAAVVNTLPSSSHSFCYTCHVKHMHQNRMCFSSTFVPICR